MRRILSYAGFFALSGYALVDTESSYRAWIWIVMCHDALRHVRPPEGNSGVFTRLPEVFRP